MRLLKIFYLALFLFCMPFYVVAENPESGRPKFDPMKFQADLEEFITSDAGLTPAEAAKFFPVYRAMMKEQRQYFERMRHYRHTDTSDDKASREAIIQSDLIDIHLKKIQQSYHQKFLKILAPGKVLRILKAEARFHRRAFKRSFNKK